MLPVCRVVRAHLSTGVHKPSMQGPQLLGLLAPLHLGRTLAFRAAIATRHQTTGHLLQRAVFPVACHSPAWLVLMGEVNRPRLKSLGS